MIYSAVGLLSYRPVDGQFQIDHENGKAAKGHSYSTMLPVGNRNVTLFAFNLVDRAQKHFLDPCSSRFGETHWQHVSVWLLAMADQGILLENDGVTRVSRLANPKS